MARSSPTSRRRRGARGGTTATQQTRGPVAKTAGELDAMAASGAVLADCHDLLATLVVAGATTIEIDQAAEEFIRGRGGIPAFKGYSGFTGSICASVNDEVVHGIPGPRTLHDGDVFAIDCGVILDGWVSDSARTYGVGTVAPMAQRLIDVTRNALDAGVAAAVVDGHIGDIGHAVQSVVEGAGFSVVRTLVGHGVGRSMHEEPQVPNFGRPGRGLQLQEGWVIAIEPMVNIGAPEVLMADDGWTISSRDGSLSAHWEHTVAVTADGPRILTTNAA